MNQNFQIGDRVAHKHYPEQAMGEISKFHNSGRVGVRNNEGTRSFLPKNLILWAPPVPPVSDAIAKPAEGIANESENLDIASQSEVSEPLPEMTIGQIVESRLENFPPVKWQIPELPPIPRDFSELDELPEWWERPVLPDFHKCDCGDRDDEDDDEDLDWVQETYGVDATYRGWKLTINDGYEIYATPPSGVGSASQRHRIYHCKCDLNLDGPDGQIAIAQEFIDSWYFAQPSPGQLIGLKNK